MLGQPASSQTVCRPSRRTSDFSSVYSGPVFNRVLIHSGLRSIGTWLLRTSRRSSLRPEGASGPSVEGVGATVSLMIDHGTPGDGNARLDGGGRCCSGAQVGSGRRVAWVLGVGADPARGGLGGGDGLAGVARGAGHGVLSVARHGPVAGGGGGPQVVGAAATAQRHRHGGGDAEDGEQPRPAPRP